MELHSRNTNTLQDAAYQLILKHGVGSSSNDIFLTLPEPMTVRFTFPYERVNLSAVRDVNPFFSLWEGLMVLAGDYSESLLSFLDVESHTAKNAEYFETSPFNHAPKRFGTQLNQVIESLSLNSLSQPVIALHHTTPILLQFFISEGDLCVTAYSLSCNAIHEGVTGSHMVILSMIQEYVALALGKCLGSLWHTSNHFRVRRFDPLWQKLAVDCQKTYEETEYPGSNQLFYSRERFDNNLQTFLDLAKAIAHNPKSVITTDEEQEPFLVSTAVPVFNSWVLYKNNLREEALKMAETISAPDWRTACVAWLQRRASENPQKEISDLDKLSEDINKLLERINPKPFTIT